MFQFYDIWNAATFNRFSCGCIVVIVGLISMIFGARTAPNMTLCSRNESIPCVLKYGETMDVCAGDHAYANITLRVDANMISPNNITIMVLGYQFSKGSILSGQFHNGDDNIDRWTNKISFQGNTMTYEIWNLKTESGDEFECHMEIDIEGEKFISKHFKWFHVDSSNCITKPRCIKDTAEQYLGNTIEQLDQLRASVNSLASDMAEQKKMNIRLIDLVSQLANKTDRSIQKAVSCSDPLSKMHAELENVKRQLDTSNKMEVAILVVLIIITAKIFITPKVQKGLQNKFSRLLDHIRCKKISFSSTSDYLTVHSQSSSGLASGNQDELSPSLASNDPQVSNTDDERSRPSSLIDLNSRVRSQSMLSLPPQDEVQDEEETTGV